MRNFERLPIPQFLDENWIRWGQAWEALRNTNPSASFQWCTHEGEKVNLKLLPTLKKQTQSHCSFCDNFPISPPSPDTIEHFRPKSTFPAVAYKWENLYYCCAFCQQQKTGDFDDRALRPDDEAYRFDDFFYWDFTTGELKVREDIAQAAKERAAATIVLYGLNTGHPSHRLLALLLRARARDISLDNFPYRSFVQ